MALSCALQKILCSLNGNHNLYGESKLEKNNLVWLILTMELKKRENEKGHEGREEEGVREKETEKRKDSVNCYTTAVGSIQLSIDYIFCWASNLLIRMLEIIIIPFPSPPPHTPNKHQADKTQ